MFWLTFLAVTLILLYVYVVKPLKFWTERNVPSLEPLLVFGNFLPVFLQKENVAELVQKVYALAPKASSSLICIRKLVLNLQDMVRRVTKMGIKYEVHSKRKELLMDIGLRRSSSLFYAIKYAQIFN